MKSKGKMIVSKLKEKLTSEKGSALGDGFVILIVIMLACGIMLIYPLMSSSEKTDEIEQLSAQTVVTEYVNKVGTTGKITLDNNNEFFSTLGGRGYTYDVEQTIMHIDENPSVKVTQAEATKIGENLYYNEYTSQIEARLDENGEIDLKAGDIYKVVVYSTNTSIWESLKGTFYGISGSDSDKIIAQAVATVSVNGSSK